ncbi:MAG: hypothetical protein HUK22_06865 [Thermoguttaceae bacterium]|nr:hypothetical protein [Thermoguttaceae bacterium]
MRDVEYDRHWLSFRFGRKNWRAPDGRGVKFFPIIIARKNIFSTGTPAAGEMTQLGDSENYNGGKISGGRIFGKILNFLKNFLKNYEGFLVGASKTVYNNAWRLYVSFLENVWAILK